MARYAMASRPIGLLMVLALMGLLVGTMALRPSAVEAVSAAEDSVANDADEASAGEWLLIRLRGDAPAHRPATTCVTALLTDETATPQTAVLVSATGQTPHGCGS